MAVTVAKSLIHPRDRHCTAPLNSAYFRPQCIGPQHSLSASSLTPRSILTLLKRKARGVHLETYFERLCQAAGVVALDAERLGDDDQLTMLTCLEQFSSFAARHASTRNPNHHIEIGFFDDDEINAFATTWENVDAIAISWGVIRRLKQEFDTALLVPDSFSWVPAETRNSAAAWLHECAKFFIFLHELGHIWNGHTSLLEARGAPAFIYELEAFGEEVLGNLDRQTMEMDADGFAAANIFRLGVFENRFPATNEELEDNYGEGATELAMIVFATHYVFRLFDAAAEFDDEELRSHPSPPLRQALILNSVLAHATEKEGMERENSMAAAMAGVNSAEGTYALVNRKEPDASAMKQALDIRGSKYTNKLLRHWHVLRPQLEALKRGGILPPVQDVTDDDV